MTPGEGRVLQQRIDELAGTRRPGVNLTRAAVRIADFRSLLKIPDDLRATKAGASPTQAEFDALFDDVQMLHTRLRGVVAALRARLGR